MGRTKRVPPELRNSEPRPSAYYRGKTYAGCGPKNKVGYVDMTTALRARALVMWAYGEQMWIYQCQDCPNWHLTSHATRRKT